MSSVLCTINNINIQGNVYGAIDRDNMTRNWSRLAISICVTFVIVKYQQLNTSRQIINYAAYNWSITCHHIQHGNNALYNRHLKVTRQLENTHKHIVVNGKNHLPSTKQHME